ncbi:ROK family protein [soil metagenome]
MYLGIDVGGTKTLVASLNNHGEIVESRKFPTEKNYDHFLLELRHALAHMQHSDWQAAGVGIPTSRFNRTAGIAYRFGNLPWKSVPIQHDLEKILKCPVTIENDAKLASLSEAKLLKDKYQRVLYVTISTGIGYGLTVDCIIDSNIGDPGGRSMLIEHRGKFVPWETFASGKAIVEHYGKRAEDIHDEKTWSAIARNLKLGFLELIAVMQPDVIVVGGSVGNYFERLKKPLENELKAYETPSLPIPPLLKAQRPEEAVVFGCYDLAKQRFGNHAATH